MNGTCAFCNTAESVSLYELPYCLTAAKNTGCAHVTNNTVIRVDLDGGNSHLPDRNTRSTEISHPKGGGCEIRNSYDGQFLNFTISANGLKVEISWAGEIHWQDIRAVLAGLPSAYLLRKRGVLPLHASGVSRGSTSLAFVGESGAGKSTLAAHYIACGWSVIADDLMALEFCDNTWRIRQGPVALRLYETAAQHASLHPTQSESLWGSGELDDDPRKLFRQAVNPAEKHLDAIFILDSRKENIKPAIKRLNQSEAHYLLSQQIFGPQVIDQNMVQFDFTQLGTLVSTVPVYRVSRPNDLKKVGATIDLINQVLRTAAESLTSKQPE